MRDMNEAEASGQAIEQAPKIFLAVLIGIFPVFLEQSNFEETQ